MSHELEPAGPRDALSDRAVALLRTAVPTAWGALIGLLVQLLSPRLPVDVVQGLERFLSTEAAIAFVTGLAIVAWYWVWRRLEPHVPDWLARLALGSARTPAYALPSADGQAVVITSLTPTSDERYAAAALTDLDRINLAHLHDFLDETDPSRQALAKVLAHPTSLERHADEQATENDRSTFPYVP